MLDEDEESDGWITYQSLPVQSEESQKYSEYFYVRPYNIGKRKLSIEEPGEAVINDSSEVSNRTLLIINAGLIFLRIIHFLVSLFL